MAPIRPPRQARRVAKVARVAAFLGVGSCVTAAFAEEDYQDEPRDSSSIPMPLQPGWAVSAFGGYGSDVDIAGDAQTFDAFGLGLGARARYTANFGLSVGARLSHHFGEGEHAGTLSSALFELGWAAPVGPLRAEPFASAGMTRVFHESSLCSVTTGACSGVGGSEYRATLGLGLSLVYPFADSFFAGATVESLLVVGPSFGLLGTATAGTTL
jgi:hypothetical protein